MTLFYTAAATTATMNMTRTGRPRPTIDGNTLLDTPIHTPEKGQGIIGHEYETVMTTTTTTGIVGVQRWRW